MRAIYKYELPFKDEVSIQMPFGSEIVKCGVQGMKGNKPNICVWAVVDPEREMETYHFCIRGTGHPLPEDDGYRYIDTVFDRQFVWHILQKKVRAD